MVTAGSCRIPLHRGVTLTQNGRPDQKWLHTRRSGQFLVLLHDAEPAALARQVCSMMYIIDGT
jgi:hypothetical protein